MMTQNQRVKKNKIIKIKRSNRFSDRIIITLDNKSVFRVPEDVFASKPLHVGDNITNKDINDYDSKMRLQEAKDAAFRLLSFRMRSICEMRKRLKQKSFTESEIDQVINKLIKLDYLNDTSFAKIFSSIDFLVSISSTGDDIASLKSEDRFQISNIDFD